MQRVQRGASAGGVLVGLILFGLVGCVVLLAMQQCGSAIGQYGKGLGQSRDRSKEMAIGLTMRQVHQALIGATISDPGIRLPEDPQQMVDWLVERGYVGRTTLSEWPAPTPGDPVFYVNPAAYRGIGSGSDIAMYEHPDNHAGSGGTVVFGDGAVRFLDQADFAHAIEQTRSGR